MTNKHTCVLCCDNGENVRRHSIDEGSAFLCENCFGRYFERRTAPPRDSMVEIWEGTWLRPEEIARVTVYWPVGHSIGHVEIEFYGPRQTICSANSYSMDEVRTIALAVVAAVNKAEKK